MDQNASGTNGKGIFSGTVSSSNGSSSSASGQSFMSGTSITPPKRKSKIKWWAIFGVIVSLVLIIFIVVLLINRGTEASNGKANTSCINSLGNYYFFGESSSNYEDFALDSSKNYSAEQNSLDKDYNDSLVNYYQTCKESIASLDDNDSDDFSADTIDSYIEFVSKIYTKDYSNEDYYTKYLTNYANNGYDNTIAMVEKDFSDELASDNDLVANYASYANNYANDIVSTIRYTEEEGCAITNEDCVQIFEDDENYRELMEFANTEIQEIMDFESRVYSNLDIEMKGLYDAAN